MLKSSKPVTPSQRFTRLVVNRDLWKGQPEKSLVVRKKATSGRDNTGKISVRHKSGPSHKRMYRLVDFRRNKFIDVEATVERLEYDPNRTAYIALIRYNSGELSYIISPDGMKAGDRIQTFSGKVKLAPGNAGKLKNIPVGTIVHCIERLQGQGANIARAAGSYARLVGFNRQYALISMRSGEVIMVPSECMATVGSVSNKDNFNKSLGKAGRKRWMGIRPTVRGTAMNPIDHPHGGGEGKTRGKLPVSPTGKPAKGSITRRNKRGVRLIVTSRRKVRKGR